MKQISYFKFFTLFPEFLDMNETNEIKIACLETLKKQYRGKNIKNPKLILYNLPVVGVVITNISMKPGMLKFKLNLEENDYFSEKLPNVKSKLSVIFRKQELFSLFFVNDEIFFKSFNGYHTYKFMTEEELINLKRKTIIESIK